jgi:glyceraldehyde 3-phosphate dehydrogenase
MAKIRIAINGFGRIGRLTFKALQKQKNVEVVAVNDLADNKTLAYLLQHDTAYGTYDKKVSATANIITVGGKKITALSERDPSALPWKKLKVDVVLECTGVFRTKESAGEHLKAGAKRVVISAPAKGDGINSYVSGVNHTSCKNDKIIDNASCTTNCTAPVMQVLEKKFGIKKAMMTTIHSYTMDQTMQDAPHKDLRRGRAAAQNMIPTTTGAAVATTKTIPSLKGKFDGLAVRVPTITVSLIDITAVLKKKVTPEQINNALRAASKKELKGILDVSDEPLVSSDYIGNTFSSTVDSAFTKVVGGDMVKILAWYDNEWGYANRLAEMAVMLGKKA